MSTLNHLTIAVVAMFEFSFGFVQEVRAGVVEAKKDVNFCRDLPVITNLTGWRGQHACEGTGPKQLTKGAVKKLAVGARTPGDHLTVARFYRAEADRHDAMAAGYGLAAANLRHVPVAKNLAAPGAASRYEFVAKGFRDAARDDRAVAATHEQMAADAIALLNSVR